MNAPLPGIEERIEKYSDLLPDDFIKDSIAREKFIRENQNASLKSLKTFKSNTTTISDDLLKIKDELQAGSSEFKKFERTNRESSDAFKELSESLRQLSQALQPKDR